MISNPPAVARTRQILEDLETVRENLLALSDDIWLSIDHNDPQALDSGVEFKRAYNTKVAAFAQIANELSALVQKYTSVRLEETEQSGGEDGKDNDRIIQELNRDEPHLLDENFTYKRPYGFVLNGRGTTGVTTWQRLYELVCKQLVARDEKRFRSLEDHPEFVSNRGHHTVTEDHTALRNALAIASNLYIEANLSANGIRDVIRRLLIVFDIPTNQLQIFLREDRDAGKRDSDG
jgi:hypothetical protein